MLDFQVTPSRSRQDPSSTAQASRASFPHRHQACHRPHQLSHNASQVPLEADRPSSETSSCCGKTGCSDCEPRHYVNLLITQKVRPLTIGSFKYSSVDFCPTFFINQVANSHSSRLSNGAQGCCFPASCFSFKISNLVFPGRNGYATGRG